MAAAVTPSSRMSANRPCRSLASGVVSVGGRLLSPTWISTPPIRPVRCPAARRPASSRNVVVDLPLVPVTPSTRTPAAGRPYTQAATWPSTERGSGTTSTGTPVATAAGRPSGSVRIATAPPATASGENAAPWAARPGSATYRSPWRTWRESMVMPVTAASGARGPPEGAPSRAARPDSGRTGHAVGRMDDGGRTGESVPSPVTRRCSCAPMGRSYRSAESFGSSTRTS